jgi:predicted nucleic acid-binding protein
MSKTVIVNSTPVIALSSIDCLGLLKKLYGNVIIPYAVKDEIGVKSKSKAQNQLELSIDWITIKEINNVAQKQTFKTQLHEGEVEVIILGQELSVDLLVIDDYNAREYAKYLGFKVIGTVGILLLAKSKGIVHEVKPLVDKLIANGIYISSRLYSEIMTIADE